MRHLDLKWFLSPRISGIFCQFAMKNSCWFQNLYRIKLYLRIPSVLLPKGQSFCEKGFKIQNLSIGQPKGWRINPRYGQQRKFNVVAKPWVIDIDRSQWHTFKDHSWKIKQSKYPGWHRKIHSISISPQSPKLQLNICKRDLSTVVKMKAN